MKSHLHEASCAAMPVSALGNLGALRACPDLHGLIEGDRLWLFWPAGETELARAILALGSAEMFHRQASEWRRLGEHLPIFHVPDPDSARPLSSLLFPAPVAGIPPGEPEWRPASLDLLRDDSARPASALLTTLEELARWADSATSHQLSEVRAASCGSDVLLQGARLPALAGPRFWGKRVLVPLGYRLAPALDEGVLVEALRLQADEIALVTEAGVEVIPGSSSGPVTRAGVRRAREGAPA
jgi:hypothetical protein